MNIFSLPFFINTYENLDRMESGRTGKLLFEEMKKKGLMPLAWGENGFRQLTNSKHPVRKPEDLNGLKVRVVGSPIFIDIFRELGADPVNMNWGDAVTAFQQGTVDGQENPVAILIAVQIYQYQKYATFWNYLVDPLILYWSKKQWDTFPADIRQAIRSAAQEAACFEKALCRAGLDGDVSLDILKNDFSYSVTISNPVEYLEANGMHVRPLSSEEHAAFKTATRPVFDKWVEKIGTNIYTAACKDMDI
jgi:TRAP-type C4-dicarboxylate transport system substrate-binding protein